MKQLLSTLCALLALAAAPMWAAKRVQSETTDLTKNTTTKSEILIDTDRLRLNDGQSSVMFLTKGGDRMVMLNTARNEYQEMDKATMDSMAQQMGGMAAQLEAAMKGVPPEQRAMIEQMMKGRMAQAAPAVAKAETVFAAKGAGTVNGFRCTNYEGTEGGQKVSEVCAATPADLRLSAGDFQVTTRMQAFSQGLRDALQSGPLGAIIPQSSILLRGVDGIPVQTIKYSKGKAIEQTQVKSVTDATFTDADFSTGSAKKVEMPGLGAARGKAKGR